MSTRGYSGGPPPSGPPVDFRRELELVRAENALLRAALEGIIDRAKQTLNIRVVISPPGFEDVKVLPDA